MEISETKEIRLERKWWIFFLGSAVILGGIFYVVWDITWPAVKAERLGQALPATWSWTSIILFDLVMIVSAVILCREGLVQLLTVFTDVGITRTDFVWSTAIRWEEITDMKGYNLKGSFLITVKTLEKSLKINLLYYKDPDQMVSLIRSRAPAARWD